METGYLGSERASRLGRDRVGISWKHFQTEQWAGGGPAGLIAGPHRALRMLLISR